MRIAWAMRMIIVFSSPFFAMLLLSAPAEKYLFVISVLFQALVLKVAAILHCKMSES